MCPSKIRYDQTYGIGSVRLLDGLFHYVPYCLTFACQAKRSLMEYAESVLLGDWTTRLTQNPRSDISGGHDAQNKFMERSLSGSVDILPLTI